MSGIQVSVEIQAVLNGMGKSSDISGNDNGMNESHRSDVLADIDNLTHYAVQGNFVLVRTNKGRCLIEKREIHGAPMVGFIYKEHNKIGAVSFWFNAESVEHLGPLLRNNSGKRVSMQSLAQE